MRSRADSFVPADPIPRRHKRDFGKDPLAYYRERFSGLTRGELVKRDQSLYRKLRRAGLLAEVPLANRVIDDALDYYSEHYQGLTRGELSKRDPSLYKKLRLEGQLEHVPTKRTR
jgi:hypothetical protein